MIKAKNNSKHYFRRNSWRGWRLLDKNDSGIIERDDGSLHFGKLSFL